MAVTAVIQDRLKGYDVWRKVCDGWAEAEAFLAGTELRDAMQRAGAEGQPRIEIYEDAQLPRLEGG